MRTLAAALSTLLLVACSGGGGDPPPPPTTGSFRVVNGSSVAFDEIYVAPTDAQSWGAVLNPAPVPSGSSFTVSEVAPGLKDVEVVSYDTIYEVVVPYYAWGTDWMVDAGATTQVTFEDVHFTGALRVYNGDSYLADITALYVVPHDATYGWGNDQLGGGAIAPYDAYVLWAIPPDYYDVLCEFDDGIVSEVVYDVAVSPLWTTELTCDAVGDAKLAPAAGADAAKGTLGSSPVGGRYTP